MTSLQPIAFDVLICMSQLFDYYLFAVSYTTHILSAQLNRQQQELCSDPDYQVVTYTYVCCLLQ